MQKHFWFGVAAVALAVYSSPALAQYHSFTPVGKAVEVDLGVLDDLPVRGQPRAPSGKTFRKLSPPPRVSDSVPMGVYPEPIVRDVPVYDFDETPVIMSAPPLMPSYAPPSVQSPAAIADMATETMPEPLRLTPPDLPPHVAAAPAVSVPPAMPAGIVPLDDETAPMETGPALTTATEPETPVAPARRRVLKPQDTPMADTAISAGISAEETAALPMPLTAPAAPPVPAAQYPSYMTAPGQVSAPSRVSLPAPKPATQSNAPVALPAHKPASVLEPVAIAAPQSKPEAKTELPPLDVTAAVEEKEIPAAAPVIEQAIETVPAPQELAAQEIPVVPSASDLSIAFSGNGSDLSDDAQKKLLAVVKQLEGMGESRLQVRAYATGEEGSKSSARRISLSRALAVRSFLMDAGIKPTRVDVRAMGTETDRSPLDRVDLLFAR